jgi:predicted PolB exonuclease-like 3'-5' exonuclease
MKDLFHFDIESVGSYPDFETFKKSDERGSKLFEAKFKKMNWEEKYDSIDDAYIQNAGIISTFGKIVCISCGYISEEGDNRISSYYGDDEEKIVNDFNELLKKVEKKNFNLSGFRIINFDIPWVLHKLLKYGIKPAEILNTIDKKPWDMRISDLSEDWKGKFAWAFSFDEVTYQLGIDSPKENLNGSEVHGAYWSGRIEDIKKYCESDVKASIEVSKKIYI